MRLITSKLVDAFPELDEFPIEQRLAFLNRAVKRWWVIVLPFIAAALATIISLTIVGFLASIIQSADMNNRRSGSSRIDWIAIAHLLILIIPLCIGGFIFLLTRDILCRRRITQIIQQRFNCAGCRYKLAGLAISDDNTATCPECGMTQSVDPSLRELTNSQQKT
jgi:hypothetical protein